MGISEENDNNNNYNNSNKNIVVVVTCCKLRHICPVQAVNAIRSQHSALLHQTGRPCMFKLMVEDTIA